jgi:hypothetical protein
VHSHVKSSINHGLDGVLLLMKALEYIRELILAKVNSWLTSIRVRCYRIGIQLL